MGERNKLAAHSIFKGVYHAYGPFWAAVTIVRYYTRLWWDMATGNYHDEEQEMEYIDNFQEDLHWFVRLLETEILKTPTGARREHLSAAVIELQESENARTLEEVHQES